MAVTDSECTPFLQWALPRLGRRWEGYRKVRRRVCKVIGRRADELGLASLSAYREYVEQNPGEWSNLDLLMDVTISRFYRDRAVFDYIRTTAFPALVDRAHSHGTDTIRVWSAGCANGEEPYTLAMIWELAIAPSAGLTRLEVLGTDIKPGVLLRASNARFQHSSLRDLPSSWRETAFGTDNDELVLRPRFRNAVTFARHDIRTTPPDGPFDLILCRYQAFTYFDESGQRETAQTLAQVTRPGAILVLGGREDLPAGTSHFRTLVRKLGVFERDSDDRSPRVLGD